MRRIERQCWTTALYKKFAALFLLCTVSLVAMNAQNVITGVVKDATNETLPGTSITIKGTQQGVSADSNGRYSIKVGENATLVFSLLSYTTKEVKVRAGQTEIDVVLDEDSQMLDEVVIDVGYGVMKKKDFTGAVGAVNAIEMAKQQPNTMQDLLRTSVPGLAMGVSTDAKGNAGNIVIRGKGSISGTTTPLLVLDGVIYHGQLTDINPADVERIDVLKDASSAAVYGAQSANGVIIITTKKGNLNEDNKPTIRFSAKIGAKFRSGLPGTYKGEEYLGFRQEAIYQKMYRNGAKDPFEITDPRGLSGGDLAKWRGTATGDDMKIWFSRLQFAELEADNYIAGRFIDWEKETYRTAINQDYSVSVSGKTPSTTYFTSLNYTKNQTNSRESGYAAIRARLNLESRANKVLSYGVNAQFINRDEGYVPMSGGAYSTVSPYGNIYDDEGNLRLYVNDDLNQTNPFLSPTYTNKRHEINVLNASLFLKADLPFGFQFKTTYSPRYTWAMQHIDYSTKHPAWGAGIDNANRANQKRFVWQWDNLLTWNKDFGDHSFSFTYLLNWERDRNWNDELHNRDFLPNDDLGSSGIHWGTMPTLKANDQLITANAQMGRIHYSYANKYMLTATFRRDGYSAFGKQNPYANFPSVAAGWVFSEESFFPKTEWFEYGKLRASWGKTGNRGALSPLSALLLLSIRKYDYVNASSGAVIPLNTYYASRMANHNLRWETVGSFNVGLDFTALKGRLNGSIDAYQKKTTDLLLPRRLPQVSGYESVTSNMGELRNTGIELMLNSSNMRIKNFAWNTTFTFTWNKNRIHKLYGLMEDVYDSNGNVVGQREQHDYGNKRFIGKSLDAIWDYKMIGVWQENEAAEAKKYGFVPGDAKTLDVDENGKYSAREDKVFQGQKDPKFRATLRNEFTLFNDFTVSVDMYGAFGHKGDFGDRVLHSNALVATTNMKKSPYWTPENPTNRYARLASNDQYQKSVWRCKSFVRFENISVGYNLPKKYLKPLSIQALNVNLTLQNAGYISNWDGEDPEVNGNNPKVLYFGLNLTF